MRHKIMRTAYYKLFAEFLKRQGDHVRSYGWIVLWKKLCYRLFLLTELIIGLVVNFFVLMISPITKIRFGHLYTSRLGHLGFNMDNYLCLCKKNNSNEIGVFITDSRIANLQIIKMWKRNNNIKFLNCFTLVVRSLQRFFPESPALIQWHRELNLIPNSFSTFPPNLHFTDDEERKAANLLKKFGINKPFVCFHNRDSQYLEKYGKDGNYHDFRDSRIIDYVQAINFILCAGYHAIRMGESVKEPLNLNDKNYINYAELHRDEFMDVYLMARAFFTVSTATGFSIIPRLFRKPQLIVNYIPFRVNNLTDFSAGSIIIFKKLYSYKKNRYLKFSEIEGLGQDIHYQGNFYEDNNIKVEDNTPEEICEAVKEMESRLSGNWSAVPEDEDLQNQFWNSLVDKESVQILSKGLRTRIGAHFLKNNSCLI